jgi:hypothetical protein
MRLRLNWHVHPFWSYVMRFPQAFFALVLAAVPLFVSAQDNKPLEQQMTTQEFQAAGLNKLSESELATLKRCLGRHIQEQTQTQVAEAIAKVTEEAREEGRQEVVRKNRGFFHFGTEEPIEARIQGEFAGFASGRKYQLDNDQQWEQIDSTRLEGVRKTNPKVSIKPGIMGVWWMKIENYNTQAKVRRIK